MSWRRHITPAILRRVIPSLTGNCAALNLLNGARYASQFYAVSPAALNDNLGRALGLRGLPAENKSPADIWANKSDSLKLPPPPDTWTGRRIVVRESGLQDAFHQLNQRLRQNRVAKEIALTVRHEKKGDKRARLRSERWRKRFADAVRKKVQLVSTIRRRGG